MKMYLLCCILGMLFNAVLLVSNLCYDDIGLAAVNLVSLLVCMYYAGRASIQIAKH